MVERKLTRAARRLAARVDRPGRETCAFAIVALYLGIDMLSHLDGDHDRAESLLDLGVSYAPLVSLLLPAQREATDA